MNNITHYILLVFSKDGLEMYTFVIFFFLIFRMKIEIKETNFLKKCLWYKNARFRVNELICLCKLFKLNRGLNYKFAALFEILVLFF